MDGWKRAEGRQCAGPAGTGETIMNNLRKFSSISFDEQVRAASQFFRQFGYWPSGLEQLHRLLLEFRAVAPLRLRFHRLIFRNLV
jgi:hypothetical protein